MFLLTWIEQVHVSSYLLLLILYRFHFSNFPFIGPTEAMVSDFWEMIIQEKSTVIVMLTNVIEHAVVCTSHDYTPNNIFLIDSVKN